MGVLDTVLGTLGAASPIPTDEDHVEDGLGGVDEMLDDVGGMLDSFGLGDAAGKLGGVTGVINDVTSTIDQLEGNQTVEALPVPTYYFAITGTAGGGTPRDFPDAGGLLDQIGSQFSLANIEKVGANAIGLADKKAGEYASALTGHFLGDGPPKEEVDQTWWIYEFECTEYLNDLFVIDVHLLRREGDDITAPTAGTSVWDQATGGSVSAIQQFVDDAKDPNKLLDDFMAGTNPDEAFFDKGFPLEPLDPDIFLNQTCSVHVSRKKDDGTIATERWFTGVCTGMQDLGRSDYDSAKAIRHIHLRIEPSLAKLGLQSNCRVFENKTSVEIVKDVLKAAGIYQLGNQVKTVLPTLGNSLVPIPLPITMPGAEDSWVPKREYCVQYNETDLAFVRRILAEDGISFYFDHAFYAERLVLLDNSKAGDRRCQTIDGKPAVVAPPDKAKTIKNECVWAYRTNDSLRPSRLRVRDFNISKPDDLTEVTFGQPVTELRELNVTTGAGVLDTVKNLVGAAAKAVGMGPKDYGVTAEHYVYPGRFVFERDTSDDNIVAYKGYTGKDLARFFNKTFRGRSEVVEGASNLLSALAGGSMRCVLHVPADKDFASGDTSISPATIARMERQARRGEKLILTSIHHYGETANNSPTAKIKHANNPDPTAATTTTPTATTVDTFASPGYYNTFTAIVSEETPLKPPPVPAKPVIAGIQTATVLGEQGSTNEDGKSLTPSACDELGRVRLQFHWDRRHTTSGTLADGELGEGRAFHRVAQTLAGAGWGVHFTPRAGMEVAVGFLEGDPDRPIILGCVHNVRLDENGTEPADTTANVPPFPPRMKKEDFARSGIVTHSVGDYEAKYSLRNRLVFQDLAQNEIIELWATRNYREQTLGDYQILVFEDLHNTLKGDQSVDILGTETRTIEGVWRQMVVGRETITIGTSKDKYEDPNGIIPVTRNVVVTGNASIALGPYDAAKGPPAPAAADGQNGAAKDPEKKDGQGVEGAEPEMHKTEESGPSKDAASKWDEAAKSAKFNRTEVIGEWDIRRVKGSDGKSARPAEVDANDAIHTQIRGHRHVIVDVDDKVVAENDRVVLVDGALKIKCAELSMGAEPASDKKPADGAGADKDKAAADGADKDKDKKDEGAGLSDAATGIHSTPSGLRLDAQTNLVANANKAIRIQADLDDKTKGVEVVGPKAVHLNGGGETGEHIALILEEEKKRVYLRGRTSGVALQWGDDIRVLVQPGLIELKTATASLVIKGDENGFDVEMKGTTLELDFTGDMFVEALEGKVDMGATTTVHPNDPKTDPSNNPKVLIDEDENHKGEEEEWHKKFEHSAAASNDASQVDADHDHYDKDAKGTDTKNVKQYKPPPDNAPPPAATPAPAQPPGNDPNGANPAPGGGAK